MSEGIRKAVEFCGRLRLLIAAAPDEFAAEDMRKILRGVQMRFARSDDEKQEAVLIVIRDGAARYDEIKDETGIRKEEELDRLLGRLREAKMIRREKDKNGRVGRPAWLYFEN